MLLAERNCAAQDNYQHDADATERRYRFCVIGGSEARTKSTADAKASQREARRDPGFPLGAESAHVVDLRDRLANLKRNDHLCPELNKRSALIEKYAAQVC